MADNHFKWFHCNHYDADSACDYCQGVIRHEAWRVFVAPIVSYAHEIVADPNKLTRGDALMLHALGVAWDEKQPAWLIADDGRRSSMDLMLEMAHFGMACRT